MKTLLILLFVPLISFSQQKDPHIKARNNAYTSMICYGTGALLGSAILASDPDNTTGATAMFATGSILGLVFQISAWHNVGKAADKRVSYYITPVGAGVRIAIR